MCLVDEVIWTTLQEEILDEVRSGIKTNSAGTYMKLKGAMDIMLTNSNKYISLAKNLGVGAGAGKNELDKHRIKSCQKRMVSNENY